ncbi:hypothetical protein GH733_003742 [Mirounga leonina]|nr:hypothetical protein GH733_003742 [Mirounga leonina]
MGDGEDNACSKSPVTASCHQCPVVQANRLHSHGMAALGLSPTRAVSTQDPAYIQESEVSPSSKDHSSSQDVDLFACSGLEPPMLAGYQVGKPSLISHLEQEEELRTEERALHRATSPGQMGQEQGFGAANHDAIRHGDVLLLPIIRGGMTADDL